MALFLVVNKVSYLLIKNDYPTGLDGSRIESRWDRIFRTRSDRPWGLTSLLYNGYRLFPGCKAAVVWC